MKALITGGGTGGHFYPALAVMSRLKAASANNEVLYLGTGHGLESDLIRGYDWIDFLSVNIRGLSRQSLWRLALGLAVLPLGMIQGLYFLIKHRPDIIYGTGGYASFPVAFWGAILRFPVVIHELNVRPGLTNRLLAPLVNKIAISYPETKNYFPERKCVLTGTPVREELYAREGSENKESNHFGLDGDLPIILVFGGSKGSEVLVKRILEDIGSDDSDELGEIQFLIQTGADNYSAVKTEIEDLGLEDSKSLTAVEYIEDMGSAYELCDLVVCRGGASTMAELIATRTPAIIVPWSGAAENHQYHNARVISESGAAILMDEVDWLASSPVEEIRTVLWSGSGLSGASSRLDQMTVNYDRIDQGDATEILISLFEDITNEESYVNDRLK